jgi:dipeptidyl aminopeptidase/acylaminoacyl peptidase
MLAACGGGQPMETQKPAGNLTIERLIDIKHPSSPVWSPDGRLVAFIWDRAGVQNVFVADAGAPAATPRALTSYDAGGVGNLFWSKDGATLYFARGGDLWQVAPGGGEPKPVWTTKEGETAFSLSPDGTRVAFVRSVGPPPLGQPTQNELWVRTLADLREVRLVSRMGSVSGGIWSPDGKRLAFGAAQSVQRADAPAYSGAKILYSWVERSPNQLYVVPASGGKPSAIAPGPDSVFGARWIDLSRLVFERQTDRDKRRQILVADAASGTAQLVHEDVEEKFWSMPFDAGGAPQPSPDGRWIAFLSDRDGWDQLYVMPAGGGAPVEITRGKFETWRPAWSPDGTRIAFDANEDGRPGDRYLGIATLGSDPSKATVERITTGRGTDTAPLWSPDGRRLVYQHTDPQNSADLFLVDATASAKPARLGDSMPAGIDHAAFVEPEFVHYPGPDGQQVPAWLFVPRGLDRAKKHPAIVWIHGDGINQNYDGWHVQRNYAVYYSFHQYLLEKGYVVLAPDYRGSIGYGRAWRDAVYMDVGGNDARDAAKGGDYLKTLSYVDPDRIGVWGLSYGGFFTLLALTDRPTEFNCGIDVAGVADYRMYYTDPYHGGWTVSRIGTPEENPKVYDQASPIDHMDQLVRPLLVLHGTSDVNVPYLESVRLIDVLLKQGKGGLVEFMVYPGEFHYFTRAHVLGDAWSRAERFFNAHLKPGS